MAKYESITQYLTEIESVPGEELENLIYKRFMPACYAPDITDHDYFTTLEEAGLNDEQTRYANIEAMDLRTVVALLTLVLRADRANNGFGKILLEDAEDGLLQRILRRIAELDGTWRRPSVVTFYHEYEENGYLSNWYEAGFELGSLAFPTSEHWMMWEKACVFGDSATASEILRATSPDAAKQLGRKVTPFDPKVWDDVCLPLVRVGLRHKFAQNDRLLNDLLSTGSAVLAEASPRDDTWGVGVGQDKAENLAEWHGRNLLGITLMNVRSDLRALCGMDGDPSWGEDELLSSPAWQMSLLELSRVPSTRPMALAYATIVAQHNETYHDARDVLRKVDDRICYIHDAICASMSGGLPIEGWFELLDELCFQVRAGRL